MKLITWNVNGLRAISKKGFHEFMSQHQPDILCLQEIKAHVDQIEDELKSIAGWQAYFSSAIRRGYSGVGTYSKQKALNVMAGIGIRKFDLEGRFIITDYGNFLLYNIYFPNGSSSQARHDYKQEFLYKLNRHLQKDISNGRQIIVVGDYNVAHLQQDVFDPERLSTVSGFLPEERQWFDQFLSLGFTDVYRYFYPEVKEQYTWWSYRERARELNRGWRIDHICVTQGLVTRLKRAEILHQQLGSDHCPVMVEFEEG